MGGIKEDEGRHLYFRKSKMSDTEKLWRYNQRKKPKKTKEYLSSGGRHYSSNTSFNEQKQLCIFKSKFKYGKALNLKHLAYIQREGKGLHGTTPELYGASPDNYEKRAGHLH